jgi:hypothetical protein
MTAERFDPDDYSVVVKRNKKPQNSWRWEIHRARKSVPVMRSPVYFQTMAAATRAGKAALKKFLTSYALPA